MNLDDSLSPPGGRSLRPSGFDPAEYGSHFPVLERFWHFNVGYEGALSLEAFAAGRSIDERKLRQGKSQADYPETRELSAAVRQAFATQINAPAGDIALSTSTTHAVGLLMAKWVRSGDIVVTSTSEHEGLRNPLEERADIEVHRAPIESLGATAESLVRRNGGRTVRIVASAVAWDSGKHIDPRVRRLGLPTVIDGAQAFPVTPFDAKQWSDETIYIAPAQKHLNGPQGLGFIYFPRRAAADLRSPMPNEASAAGLRRAAAGVDEAGPHPFDAYPITDFVLAQGKAAFDLGDRYGFVQLGQHVVAMADHLADRLRAEGLQPLDRHPSAIVTWPDERAKETSELLRSKYRIIVRAINTADGPVLRASLGGWTSPEHVEYLVQALRRLKPR